VFTVCAGRLGTVRVI